MKKLLTSLALGVILTLGFLAGILPPSSADGPQTAALFRQTASSIPLKVSPTTL
ncbi:hypothetical protein P4U97_07020 [Bacillus swezeyi]|uniref:hypothetical protein n=1 Tax=Bacillus swezeyi TaxID=1925020 RepID=UPI002E1BE4D4|nr:hypothetical protein [Bacillus swezeyi]